MRTDLALDALEQAPYECTVGERDGLVHHSDRSVQGRFKRSSQHRFLEAIINDPLKPRPGFSNQVFFSVAHSMSQKGLGKHHREGISLIELFRMFPDDATAQEWLEEQRWSGEPWCPHCGSFGNYALDNTIPKLWRSRRPGTIFSWTPSSS